MPVRDPHAVLGVSADASDEQIHQAYRRRAKLTHPDSAQGSSSAFAEVQAAYDALRSSRRTRGSEMGLRAQPLATAFDSFFDSVDSHERSKPTPQRGQVGPKGEVVVEITLEQAYAGGRMHVVRDGGMCEACKGRGRIRTQRPQPCLDCGGFGYINAVQGFITVKSECGSCSGTGRSNTCSCPECGGQGRGDGFEVDVDIPQGCRDGFVVTPSDLRGVQVVVKVVPHAVFQRSSRRIEDLVATLEIPVWAATLGHAYRFDGIEGEAMSVVVPPGSWHGDEIKVPQRGMPAFSGRGDVIFRISVRPPGQDAGMQDLLRRMKALDRRQSDDGS